MTPHLHGLLILTPFFSSIQYHRQNYTADFFEFAKIFAQFFHFGIPFSSSRLRFRGLLFLRNQLAN